MIRMTDQVIHLSVCNLALVRITLHICKRSESIRVHMLILSAVNSLTRIVQCTDVDAHAYTTSMGFSHPSPYPPLLTFL
jgi:hypothetical protein